MRILVIEDEDAISDFLARGLEAEGYSVTCAADGEQGEMLALRENVALVILDVLLPGKDGHAALQGIRRDKPALPVVMLTARDQVEDKVRGLDTGATDYVTKPFSFDELVARIRAHLRLPGQTEPTVLEGGDIRADLLERRVTHGDGEVSLTAREFDLLAYFLRRKNQVLSREQILGAVWGIRLRPGDQRRRGVRGVPATQARRRRPPGPDRTVRSVGYRLADRG